MLHEKNWRERVKQAEHYLAVGNIDQYLGSVENDWDFPWEFCTGIGEGGSHRLEMSTTVSFQAEHPCGLEFRWYLDLEKSEANGRGYYMIDVPKIRTALSKLSGSAKLQFIGYLQTGAAKVRAKAEEWRAITERQFRDAEILESFK